MCEYVSVGVYRGMTEERYSPFQLIPDSNKSNTGSQRHTETETHRHTHTQRETHTERIKE